MAGKRAKASGFLRLILRGFSPNLQQVELVFEVFTQQVTRSHILHSNGVAFSNENVCMVCKICARKIGEFLVMFPRMLR